MLDKLGYNENHWILFWGVKYPFISEKNASNEIPLKSPFEALNYYISLRPLRPKTNPSVVFKTLKSTFAISQELQK